MNAAPATPSKTTSAARAPIVYQRFAQAKLGLNLAEPTARQPIIRVPSSANLVKKRKRTDKDVKECEASNKRSPKMKKDSEHDGDATSRAEVRADHDARRKAWVYAHRVLFEPLLPPNATYFNQVVKEMAAGNATPPVPLREFVEQPKLITGGKMKDYQLAGLGFLANMYHNGVNCILGDEMGLGKTVQTLSLFAHLKETTSSPMMILIVCPLSVLSSWETECKRWLPSMLVLRFHGNMDERERLKRVMRDDSAAEIVLTTYETLSTQDFGWLKTRRWDCVVLDEGHRIKNAGTEVSSRAASIGGFAWRVILTGTPIQNNLTELWALLHWLYPQIFTPTTQQLFAASFDLSTGSYSQPFLNAVRKFLDVVQLRRIKSKLDLGGELGGVPPKEEWTVFIPFTEAQRFWTWKLLTKLEKVDLHMLFPEQGKVGKDDEDSVAVDDGRAEVFQTLVTQAQGSTTSKQWKKFAMLLMRLRQVCDHPYMIDDAMPEHYEIGEHIVASSSKMLAIDKILMDVLPKGERVLMFSQFTVMLDLVEDYLVLRGYQFVRLDGSVSRARRELVIRLFQQDDSKCQVFLISTKAGGLGINLTKASTCILCDSDWNPQNDLQAIARAHRIGQTKVVKVFRLICRGSVEDQMLDRLRRKLFLAAKIIGVESAGQSGDDGTHGGAVGSELLSILRRGSSALTCAEDGMDITRFRAASLQEILDASRVRDDVHNAKVKHDLNIPVKEEEGAAEGALLRSAEEEERALLSGVARVQSYLFEGELLTRAKASSSSSGGGSQSVTPTRKREQLHRTVNIGGMTFLVDDSMEETSLDDKSRAAPSKEKKKPRFKWEDYCITCRDGGEVVMCDHCPRVFHAECHATLSAVQVNAAKLIICGQHGCIECRRNTSEAGGMLLRCQTCQHAYCTDCVDWDRITMVGDTIPEFVSCDYGKKDNSYFIRCMNCCELAKVDPEWAAGWESEIAESQRKVDQM
ncbi:ISWI chromatin-remodeling complex ATPase ISW2 [Favolaschia claudopus]|uniref:ISWI chromatin-remodeling complex ATPase ISW2 n=1 Tax=Favolaschia claudopus TaxID=2862362 RepID=A0AAW0EI29_9AGAR